MKHFLQHIRHLVLISKPCGRYARRHPSTFVKNARNERYLYLTISIGGVFGLVFVHRGLRAGCPTGGPPYHKPYQVMTEEALSLK